MPAIWPGPRAGKPYLALNCGSIPEDAVESELFGDALQGKKGFFEQANGGSVLLDEIGEMSPRMQTKLLLSQRRHLPPRWRGS
jgi:transcriptional regulator of aroF, aroG, tyrA and aromatic amino acid transport